MGRVITTTIITATLLDAQVVIRRRVVRLCAANDRLDATVSSAVDQAVELPNILAR
jgi:hypothetical protein